MKEWKEVEGYGGRYIVSDYGDVWSVERTCRFVSKKGKESLRRVRGRLLIQKECGPGYLKVVLSKAGKERGHMTHRLVVEHFINKPSGKMEVNHKNGDKYDNRAVNLEWLSCSENHKHSYRIGLRKTGKDHHFAKMARNEKGYCVSIQDRGGLIL